VVGSDISPYDRLVWADGELEQALASGTRRRDAEAYLGDTEYAQLQPLALAALRTAQDPQRVVHLIPGIMGSQLGLHRAAGEPPDLLWVDPIDVQRGRLAELALTNPHVVSLGPVIYTYLSLKLRLEAAGYRVRWFDYDWRRSLADCAALLAAQIRVEPAAQQFLVGHSMGGLVARAASAAAAGRVTRIVTLGTPHGGSYAPLQALRGSYISVRRVVQLDPEHSTEALTESVFGGFPSLYQMLPAGGSGPDLRDLAQWPDSLPRPQPALLREIGPLHLQAPPARMYCIAGTGYETVNRIERMADQFRYHIDRCGDGTVSVDSATLGSEAAWYSATLHGELPRDERIAATVIDLVAQASSTRLPQTAPSVAAAPRSITDAELRQACVDKLDWARMSPAERHDYFCSLNAPVAAGSLLTPQS
jgi:pimeloyl-ACP methyl ester carboxylesterase